MPLRPPPPTLFPYTTLFRSPAPFGPMHATNSPGPASSETPASATLRPRSEEHTSELQSRFDLVCRLLLEKKKTAHPVRAHSPGVRLTPRVRRPGPRRQAITA